ncbi:hypothetical protein L208DRAFT_1282338 [Tricholoma matsutake]|nr:hypothetical protein L208DRAFT_1282338 [Tricholoma matsutake 945]
MAYTHTFIMDGNFSTIHQNRENAQCDIKLTHSEFFMTEPNCWSTFIILSLTTNWRPTCNEHHAMNDWFIKYKGLDVTRIGATTCGCHGCFCPGVVVDFQKGEQQANMDYSLSEALKNTNIMGLKRLIAIYNIMCQYWKRLKLCME